MKKKPKNSQIHVTLTRDEMKIYEQAAKAAEQAGLYCPSVKAVVLQALIQLSSLKPLP